MQDSSNPITGIATLINSINNILVPALVLLGFVLIIKAGYGFLTSQGNPDQVKKSKEDLTSAIIGLIFVFLSGTILRVILSSLGF